MRSKFELMKKAQRWGRVSGRGVWRTSRRRVSREVSVSGGPPVPRIREGSWAGRGAVRSLARSSAGPGETILLESVIWDSCRLWLLWVSGMASSSSPISSARSVTARLEEPTNICRPRTRYAVKDSITTKPTTRYISEISKRNGWGV